MLSTMILDPINQLINLSAAHVAPICRVYAGAAVGHCDADAEWRREPCFGHHAGVRVAAARAHHDPHGRAGYLLLCQQ